jgi:hypothetical protein
VDDFVLEGGRVVDGTGAPWFVADVAVRGGRVAAIGSLSGRTARRRIDARGLVVAPGFIDLLGQSEYNVLVDGRAASKITQGITTDPRDVLIDLVVADRPRRRDVRVAEPLQRGVSIRRGQRSSRHRRGTDDRTETRAGAQGTRGDGGYREAAGCRGGLRESGCRRRELLAASFREGAAPRRRRRGRRGAARPPAAERDGWSRRRRTRRDGATATRRLQPAR